MELIGKSALVAEIEKLKDEAKIYPSYFGCGRLSICKELMNFLDTLEVKEVNLNNGIQLTWEDIRELYIIFAEVDVDIELCKTADIQAETIGYYQEVLKRFKAQKGE